MKTLLKNAKIYVEKGIYAQALYQEDGWIKFVGSDEDAKAFEAGADRVIDCGKKTVVPGFNNNHSHPLMVAEFKSYCDLYGAESIDEIVERGKAFLAKMEHPERGMRCTGWNVNFFTSGEKRPPNRFDLDRISTEVPIVAQDAAEHETVCNSKAMEVVGFTKDSPDVDGGVIRRDETGEPMGNFAENAQAVVKPAVPVPDMADIEKGFREVMEELLKCGYTSVQANDAGITKTPQEVYACLHRMRKEDSLLVRYHTQNCYEDLDDLKAYIAGEYACGCYDDYLSRGPLKLFKDGTIGSRSALLDRDWADDPGNRGQSVNSNEKLLALSKLAQENGMQIICHCIGNQAITDLVDIYEQVQPAPGNPLRNTVNHCQLMTMPLIDRLADLNIMAAVQPIFLNSDLHALASRVDDAFGRTSNAYKTMLEKGIPMSFGTDSPVEGYNALAVIYSAVTRKDLKGYPPEGYYPEECLDVETAVDCFTLGSAYQQFMEDRKGRLKPGFFADLCVLSEDIFTVEPDRIKDIVSVLTMVDGKIRYEA
ncbi:MAG: amidohydrolase [Clostridia bacterium]|nr:amidohydrolase [Clostridia bacterium]